MQNPVEYNRALIEIGNQFDKNKDIATKIIGQIKEEKKQHRFDFSAASGEWIQHHKEKKHVIVNNIDDLKSQILLSDQYEYFNNQNKFLANMGWITLFFGANAAGNLEDLKTNLHNAIEYFFVCMNNLTKSAFVLVYDDFKYNDKAFDNYLSDDSLCLPWIHNNLTRQTIYSSIALNMLANDYSSSHNQEFIQKHNINLKRIEKIIEKERKNGIKKTKSPTFQSFNIAQSNLRMIRLNERNASYETVINDLIKIFDK